MGLIQCQIAFKLTNGWSVKLIQLGLRLDRTQQVHKSKHFDENAAQKALLIRHFYVLL